jgi:hypothetical protein
VRTRGLESLAATTRVRGLYFFSLRFTPSLPPYLDLSTVVFTNVQRRAIHPRSNLPSALILPRPLLTVPVANTPFLSQLPHPISVAMPSSFALPALIRFQRARLCARSHLKAARIHAARRVILVHALHVQSHSSGRVVVVQQHGRSPAVQRRPRQIRRLFCAINLVVRYAHAGIINVLVYAAHLQISPTPPARGKRRPLVTASSLSLWTWVVGIYVMSCAGKR